jgi:ATP-dependent helicase HrpB
VGCLVIDEFHERHLDGDLCLAWAKAVQREHRPDLRILVMSATIAPGPLQEFMAPCEVFDSEGRTFPVEIGYQAPLKDKAGFPEAVWDQAARAAEELIVKRGVEGDLLVFMPGGHEIRRTISALSGRSFAKGIRILPLHGELTPAQQDEAVQPGGARRIIVSTNVAETSLTIEGVRAVIDSGLARIASYDVRRGINTLTVQKISRASADQRAGRAGRLGPGTCVRLWPEREHGNRAESELPEIRRLDLSEAMLTLAVVSEKVGMTFDWYEAPTAEAMERAVRMLHDLGATVGVQALACLDEDSDRLKPALQRVSALQQASLLTPLGRAMAAFPLHPRFSRMLLTAQELDCVQDAALCAAIAQGRDLLLRGDERVKRKQEEFFQRHDLSEFESLMRAFDKAESLNFDPQACAPWGIHARAAHEALRSAEQLLRLCRRGRRGDAETGREEDEKEQEDSKSVRLAKCLLSAFSDHLGVETMTGSRVYALAAGYKGHLDKDAHLKPPPMLVAAEVAEIQGKALQVKLNLTTRVEEEWLRELFPDDLTTAQRAAYDAMNKRVMNLEETRFRDLVLRCKERGEPDAGLAATLLAEEIVAGRVELPNWTERHEQWITRLNCLAEWMPELEMPSIGDEDRKLLIEQMCYGAVAVRQLRERTPDGALNAWLSAAQRDLLDRFAPERVKLANGKMARVEYRKGASPQISVILQQLYDTNENPRVAGGKISVSVEILAPNQRPVQTTGDLGNFWKTSYAAVKTQLKGRYPRHEWR